MAALLVIALVTGVLWLATASASRLTSYHHYPQPVLGLGCVLTVVAEGDQKELARKSLLEGDLALRDVEKRMDANNPDSEVSAFNAAGSDIKIPLSPEMVEQLWAAKSLHDRSGGAFDITILPLLSLWQDARRDRRFPSDQELAAARAESSWDQIELWDDGAAKHSSGVCLALGGLARGYAVDRAAEAMILAGAQNGLVELGGNRRCFGRQEDGRSWEIHIPDPFDPSNSPPLATLHLEDLAVSTYSLADGGSLTIIDPATGKPVEGVISVTVIAATCATAQGWCTALCVLGKKGLAELEPDAGIEAMVVVGNAKSYTRHLTPGFGQFLGTGAVAKPLLPTPPTARPSVPPHSPAVVPAPASPAPAATPQPISSTRPSSSPQPAASHGGGPAHKKPAATPKGDLAVPIIHPIDEDSSDSGAAKGSKPKGGRP